MVFGSLNFAMQPLVLHNWFECAIRRPPLPSKESFKTPNFRPTGPHSMLFSITRMAVKICSASVFLVFVLLSSSLLIVRPYTSSCAIQGRCVQFEIRLLSVLFLCDSDKLPRRFPTVDIVVIARVVARRANQSTIETTRSSTRNSKTERICRCYWNRKKTWDMGSYKLGTSKVG
jgi:hypothetical protein